MPLQVSRKMRLWLRKIKNNGRTNEIVSVGAEPNTTVHCPHVVIYAIALREGL